MLRIVRWRRAPRCTRHDPSRGMHARLREAHPRQRKSRVKLTFRCNNLGTLKKASAAASSGYWLGPPLIHPPCKNLSGLSLLRAPPPRCGRLQARRRTAAAPNHLSGLGGVSYRFWGGFPIRYVSCCIVMYPACIPHVSCRIHVSWVYLDGISNVS